MFYPGYQSLGSVGELGTRDRQIMSLPPLYGNKYNDNNDTNNDDNKNDDDNNNEYLTDLIQVAFSLLKLQCLK